MKRNGVFDFFGGKGLVFMAQGPSGRKPISGFFSGGLGGGRRQNLIPGPVLLREVAVKSRNALGIIE